MRVRALELHKGDEVFLDEEMIKKLCPEPIHMLKKFQLKDSEFQGMITKCVWTEKKWWQFWKKKKWIGCYVEIL